MNWKNVEKDIEKSPTGLFKQIFIFGILGGLVIVGLNILFKPAAVLNKIANPAAIVRSIR